MSQPPGSWDQNSGSSGVSGSSYGSGSSSGYGGSSSGYGGSSSGGYGSGGSSSGYGGSSTSGYPAAGGSSYTPPPQYGGYPPAASGQPAYGQPAYGQPGYGPGYPSPYGAPYGPPAPQRPGAALAAAVLSYIQAGVVLLSSFGVLAAATASTEALLIGILQLISVGLLIFGAVQLTSGSGRTTMLIASLLQLGLVVYWLIRFNSFDDEFDLDGGFTVVIPLFFAVMPAVALALSLNGMVTQYLAAKAAQRPPAAGQPQWGQ